MRITINDIKQMKAKGEPVTMLTAYDYATGRLVDEAGIPLILVGDSLGMVALGYDSTIPVTMDEMIHHTKAVVRGVKNGLVVGDMPFMTYQVSVKEALRNAARFIQEGGAQAVKLEGGQTVAETVKRMVECGIPVCGHIGLTPQSIHQFGGFKAQGKTPEAALHLLQDALALQSAGAFAVVLECVPYALAKIITQKVKIATIGIGAGPHCDGQVQVLSDVLGLYAEFVPRHAKQYLKLNETIKEALGQYLKEVKQGSFPTNENSYKVDESNLAGLA